MMTPRDQRNWKDRLNDWEANPQSGAPEPPTGDWERLAARIPQKKRRRRLIWWWFPLALLVVVGLIYQLDVFGNTNQADPLMSDKPGGLKSVGSAIEVDCAPIIKDEMIRHASDVVLPTSGTPVLAKPTAELINEDFETQPTNRPLLPTTKKEQSKPLVSVVTEIPQLSFSLDKIPYNQLAFGPKATFDGLSIVTDKSITSTISGLPKAVFPLQNAASLVPHTEAVLPDRPNRWWIGAATQRGTQLFAEERTQVSRPAFRQQRTPYAAYGVDVRYDISRRFTLESGIFRGREQVTSLQFWQRFYTLETERSTTMAAGVNDFSIEVTGAYSKTDAAVEVVRPTGFVLERDLRLQLRTILNENVRRTTIPLVAHYKLPLGNRSSIGLGLGVIWQRQQVSLLQSTRLLSVNGLELGTRRGFVRSATRQDRSFAGQFQLGYDHYITTNWQLSIRSVYQRGRSVLVDLDQREYFQRTAVQLSLLRRF